MVTIFWITHGNGAHRLEEDKTVNGKYYTFAGLTPSD